MPEPIVPSSPERYFTNSELKQHNHADDCWVALFGNVLDLTSLVKSHRGELTRPIIDAAGTDISHWFKSPTQVKTRIDPQTGLESPYTPQGRFLDVAPRSPATDWNVDSEQLPWWSDPQYLVGKLTDHGLHIKLVNTLTGCEDILEVAQEETLMAMQNRYMERFNQHSTGYIWRHAGRVLNMQETLVQNGIPDMRKQMALSGIDEDEWMPVFHLIFSDDLSVA
eukprot:Partr_v1_DN27024_c0_g1_i1_m29056 putative Cytochrome b5 domain containing 1